MIIKHRWGFPPAQTMLFLTKQKYLGQLARKLAVVAHPQSCRGEGHSKFHFGLRVPGNKSMKKLFSAKASPLTCTGLALPNHSCLHLVRLPLPSPPTLAAWINVEFLISFPKHWRNLVWGKSKGLFGLVSQKIKIFPLKKQNIHPP